MSCEGAFLAQKIIKKITEFLEELNSVRLASITEVPAGHNQNPPALIHCSNGERTGLTLVADLLLYTLDHNQVQFTFI